MCEKDYIVVIGSANTDVAEYLHHPLNYADSNPGKIKFTPDGVGRSIVYNLALLRKNAWLLNVVGGNSYGQLLSAQINQSDVYIDKYLIILGKNTSSYLPLFDNTGEILVAINDMSISDCISAEFLAQHQEFIRGTKVIAADCNLSEEALVQVLENSGETPVFIDPTPAWKCIKIHDHLSKIHTLKPNRLEAGTLNGTAPSGHEDVAKVTAWFHQYDLNRLVLSMRGDSAHYSDINGGSGRSAPIKTNVINVIGIGDVMMAGLASCWVGGMPFIDSVRFAQGCSSVALACKYTNNPELSTANVTPLAKNTECLS